MFTIVNDFNSLPETAEEGTKVFCSMETNVFVYSGGEWVSYESFVGGFEEVSTVTIENNIDILEEQILFNEAPYYENFKQENIYLIVFKAEKLMAFEDSIFKLDIINDEESIVFSCNAEKIMFPEFKSFFYIRQDAKNKEEKEKTADRIYYHGFNVLLSNTSVKGPYSLSIFKPVGV
jgi:hypothetical protein